MTDVGASHNPDQGEYAGLRAGMPRVRPTVAAALLFLVAGCGTAGAPEARDQPQCRVGQASPVTPDALIRALRRHGFTARDDPSMCMTEDDVAGVSNNYPEHEDEGSVLCSLGTATKPTEATVYVVRYVTDDETHVSALNAACSLYPGPDEQIELHRLYAAFDDLVRAALSRGDVSRRDFGRLPRGVRWRRCRPPNGREGACSVRAEPLTFESAEKVCLRRTNVYRDGLLVRETNYEWYC